MCIGKKIYELRTAMNLSQGNLADLLDVSRQSVSKWETDAAVPDLDKLIRLCDVFSVTLDELTGRAASGERNISPAVPAAECPARHQRVIGYILLAVSLLAAIIVWALTEREEDLYIPVPAIAAALTCSLLCLFVRQHAGYWCIWTVAAPIVLLSPYLVGMPVCTTSNILFVVFAAIMVLAAKKLFPEATVKSSGKKTVFILTGWIFLIGLRVLGYVLIMHTVISSVAAWLPHIALDLLSYIGTALLLTYTVCYFGTIRKSA